MIKHSEVSSEVNFWRDLEKRVGSALDLLGLAIEEGDNTLEESLVNETNSIALELKDKEFQLILSGEYDQRNAILAIHSGAGGTESQDLSLIHI